MARMLHDRESTNKHLNATRRHIRLCKQVKGAEKYATKILPFYDNLQAKQNATNAEALKREVAYDDIVLADNDLDNAVRTGFEKCKQFDREHTAEAVLVKVFPEEKYSDITSVERTKEPDVVEQLAVRFESLGESHELYGVAATLRERINASRLVIQTYFDAIRSQKMAEAEEEIAQAELRQCYESNYLDARKEFGRTIAERLYPRISRRVTTDDNGETVPDSL